MLDNIDARVQADFARVRSRAFLKDLLAMFSGKRDKLLPYDQVKETLRIGGPIYRGVRTVEVARIVG
ncbi:MAG: chromosome partitioning protein ParB, partial [Candidatus Methylomirabilales bacterium]